MIRWRLGLLGLAALASGCAAGGVSEPDAASRQAQVAACAAAVAAHVGKPVDAVTAVLASTGPDGTAVVNVTDGGRLHTCAVDGTAVVREIRHPGA